MSGISPQFGRVPYACIASGVLADVKPAAVKVYLVLLAHADHDWRVRVGMRRLASLTGLVLGSVSRSIKELKSIGLISANEHVNGSAYHYRIATNPPADRSRHSVRLAAPTVRATVNGRDGDRSRTNTPTVRPAVKNRSHWRERNRGTDKNRDGEQATLPGIIPPKAGVSDPSKAIVYTFQTSDGPWHLTAGQRDLLRSEFIHVHVDTHLANLANWTDRKPEGRKQPGAMMNWLRFILSRQQREHSLKSPAFYADGFQHSSLPSDPTPDMIREIFAGINESELAHAV